MEARGPQRGSTDPRLPKRERWQGRVARSALLWLCWCVLCLGLIGGVHAGLEIFRQRYLQQGLWFLSVELLAGSLRRFFGLAALAAAAVVLLPFAIRASAPVVRSRVATGLALVFAPLLAGAAYLAERPRPWIDGPLPNILLISVDTLRADHLGAYGYPRATSPAIDRLAAEGLLFRHAVAQAQWTLPSMASVHTGLYPSQHGAVRAGTSLSPSVVTLAEVLRDAGYQTLAVVTHLFVSRRFGFDQGMVLFDDSHVLGHDGVTSEWLTRTATRLTRELGDRPFFLWVHYLDPHFSYVRHPEFDFAGRTYTGHVSYEDLRRLAAQLEREGGGADHPSIREIRAVYDEEIAHTDRWIGRLIEQVRSEFPKRPLVIFLVADHGEEFLEHGGLGHDRELYEELIRVPLVIGGDIDPGLRGRQVERSVETASIPRTILELVGIENRFFRGEDLLAPDPDGESRPVFSEGSYAWGRDGRRRAVIDGSWKLIHDLDRDEYELYHLTRDPGETRSTWQDPGAELAELRARLRSQLEALSDGASESAHAEVVELDAEERRHLEELGYIEEAPEANAPPDPAPPPPGEPAPD